ncbi:hypothetical protein GQ44DRAFT_757847 [Phaeosphaeriaceae sp. PMI808]|nr:hypothetical protein GQ44DRAFT_757847 [Phaeosphaeriaceae sp. PMI808]
MTMFPKILLLAACSTLITAGPVPRNERRQLFTSFTNTTIHASSTIQSFQASSSGSASSSIVTSVVGPLSATSSLPSGQQVNADTALIIEPIQSTIITRVISAVTFLNLKGEPVATQNAETILSTSFFTPTPAPAPASPSSTVPSSSPNPASSPNTKLPVPSLKSSTVSLLSTTALALPISSQVAVESEPKNGTNLPSFTYSPEESNTRASSITPTPIITSKAPTGNTTGLPGFNHPRFSSRTIQPSSVGISSAAEQSSAIPKTSAPTASSTTLNSPIQPAPAASNSASSSENGALSTPVPNATDSITRTRIVITKTEYTTVFPSPSTIATSSAAIQQPSPPPKGSELVAGSTSAQIQQPIASPSPVTVPTTILAPPPVIVTQYTTVTPKSNPAEVPTTPAVPVPTTIAPVLSSAGVPSSSPSSPAPPRPSSKVPGAPIQPTSVAAPPLAPQASSSTTPSAQLPPVSSMKPPPPAVPSSTSDGPLIINPIASSQLFTVTVTATEKETVTATATVTVSVTARP